MPKTKYKQGPVAPSDEYTYAKKYSFVLTDEESVDLSDILGPWTSLPYDERSAMSTQQQYTAPLDSNYYDCSRSRKEDQQETTSLPIIDEVESVKEARRLQILIRAEHIFNNQQRLHIRPFRDESTVRFSPDQTSHRKQGQKKKQMTLTTPPRPRRRQVFFSGEDESVTSASYFSPSENSDSSNSCIVSMPPKRRLLHPPAVYYEYKDELQDGEEECVKLRGYVDSSYYWSLDWFGDLMKDDSDDRESLCRTYASAIAHHLCL